MGIPLVLRDFPLFGFPIAKEETRFSLKGALLEFGEHCMAKMVTTDGHRMALIEGQVDSAGLKLPSFLIPARSMRALRSMDEGPVEISFNENYLFFRRGDTLILAKKMVGSFPDYRRAIPNGGHVSTCCVAKADLETSLKRVIQFSDERSRCVRFAFSAEEVKVSAASAESGESEESIPASGEMRAPIEVGFNGTYLLDLLAVMIDDQVVFRLKDKQSSAVISHGNGGVCIIMPMRA